MLRVTSDSSGLMIIVSQLSGAALHCLKEQVRVVYVHRIQTQICPQQNESRRGQGPCLSDLQCILSAQNSDDLTADIQ